MKILQISPQIPFPVDDGGRIGIFGITKHLSLRGHEIDFVAYRKNVDIKKAYDALSLYCTPYFLEVKTENNPWKAFLNLFSNVPYNISKFIRTEMETFLLSYLSENKPDIIHVDHLHMAWVIETIEKIDPEIPIIIREHNFETNIMKRYSENQENIFLRLFARIQFNKLKKYEPYFCEKFDKCIMISHEDEKSLKSLNDRIKTKVIPAGVDSNLFDLAGTSHKIRHSMCHVGSLGWYPNLEGLQWFLDSIFPEIVNQIPTITLYVYGMKSDLLKIPENLKENVRIVGYVENLWDHVSQMELAIVPLKTGGGIRIKLLEMMAFGINILSTSIGKEGIPIEDEKHILIADQEDIFAQKTINYFSNKYEKDKMKIESKKLIQMEFTWETVAEKFETEYLKIIALRLNDNHSIN